MLLAVLFFRSFYGSSEPGTPLHRDSIPSNPLRPHAQLDFNMVRWGDRPVRFEPRTEISFILNQSMPATAHIEKHFTASDTVRDVVIGMSDGLTVPFALAAGLSGAKVGTSVVVLAGLAEIAAGSIAMGLGGFLAARTDGRPLPVRHLHFALAVARKSQLHAAHSLKETVLRLGQKLHRQRLGSARHTATLGLPLLERRGDCLPGER